MTSAIAKLKSLIWGNTSQKQTIFKNTFWLLISETVNKLLKLFVIIYVANIFGPEGYGKFSFALAFVGLFVFLPNFVFPSIVIREFSSGKDKSKDFPAILTFRIVLNILSIVAISIGAFFITQDPLVRGLIIVLAIYMQIDGLADFLSLFFQARQRMEYQSFSEVLRSVLLFVFVLLIVFNHKTILDLGWGYLASVAFAMVAIMIFFHKKIYPFSFSVNTTVWKEYVLYSWPMALGGIFGAIYSQIDSVIMGSLNMLAETGFYNAASKIVVASSLPMGMINSIFFPALNRAFADGKEAMQKMWDFQMDLAIFIIAPFILGGFVLAPKIIGFIYGSQYLSSVLVFQILLFPAIFAFMSKPFVQLLYIVNKQKDFLWITMVVAIINTVLNLVLIARFSLYGAAVASLISYGISFLIILSVALRFTPVTFLNRKLVINSFITLFACFVMFLVLTYPAVYSMQVLTSIVIGIVTYVVIFFGIKFSAKKIGIVKEIF